MIIQKQPIVRAVMSVMSVVAQALFGTTILIVMVGEIKIQLQLPVISHQEK